MKKNKFENTDSDTIYSFFLKKWGDDIQTKQQGKILLLDENKSLLGLYTVDSVNTTINPFNIIKLAFDNNASEIFLAHNRIYGELYPTNREIHSVKNFIEQTKPAKFHISDYLIMSEDGYCSFKDNNFFQAAFPDSINKVEDTVIDHMFGHSGFKKLKNAF